MVDGQTRWNFWKRFRVKKKVSAKRYNRKRERSINKNPRTGDSYE